MRSEQLKDAETYLTLSYRTGFENDIIEYKEQ